MPTSKWNVVYTERQTEKNLPHSNLVPFDRPLTRLEFISKFQRIKISKKKKNRRGEKKWEKGRLHNSSNFIRLVAMPLPPSTAVDSLNEREKNENVIAWKYSGFFFYNNNRNKEHTLHLFLFVNFLFVPKRTDCLPAHYISFLRSLVLMRFHTKLLQLQAMQRTSIDFHLKWRRWKYVTILRAANWFVWACSGDDEQSSPPL